MRAPWILTMALLLPVVAAGQEQERERRAPNGGTGRQEATAPAPPPPPAVSAPRVDQAEPRRAVPRAAPPRGREAQRTAPPRERTRTTPREAGSPRTSSGEPANGGDEGRRAVGRSRPRDGRAATGQAVERRGPPPYTVDPRLYYRYRYPSSYWAYPSYYGAFGLGYLYYDPYWSGYGGYYGPGYGGYGTGYGGYGTGYGGYGTGYGGYGTYYRSGFDNGRLRLKVKPREAEVYVDGYYAGRVDEFDGIFQRLNINVGPHRVEIREPGYEPLVFDVRIQPDQTVTYTGELKPLP